MKPPLAATTTPATATPAPAPAAATGGPRVVAIGGGHGLASTLRAARRYAGELTAIVSVADDGGSSGRLRQGLGIPAPGDLRKCLVALADPDSLWARAFEHRFEAGELEGHAVGNLIIAGLAAVTGDQLRALDEAGRLLGSNGKVLPATEGPVTLKADAADGAVEGQVAVGRARRVTQVSLVPPDPLTPPAALAALERADQVVIGPGSLYTSVLAALAVPALRDSLAGNSVEPTGTRTTGTRATGTRATRVYVCNLAPQDPETTDYDVAAHIEGLRAHGVEVDVVLCDTANICLGRLDASRGPRVVDTALGGTGGPGHDEARLAGALAGLVR